MEIKNEKQQSAWIIIGPTKKNKHTANKNLNKKIGFNETKINLYNSKQEQDEHIQYYNSSNQQLNNKQHILRIITKYKNNNSQLNIHIQCLGIGDFNKSYKSQLQLYFLEYIILKTIKSLDYCYQLNIYDPILTKFLENQLKTHFKCKITSKSKININQLNLYFLPHCQQQLYQHVLENYYQVKMACQAKQTRLIIIGNSIKEYISRCQILCKTIPQTFQKYQPENNAQIKIYDYLGSMNDTYIYYL